MNETKLKLLQVEVLVVFMWLVLPSLVVQLVHRVSSAPTVMTDLSRAASSIGESAMILYLMWRSDQALKSFGFRFELSWSLFVLSAALFLACLAIIAAENRMLLLPVPTLAAFTRRGLYRSTSAIIAITLAAASEEFAFRSYFITRLEEVLPKRNFAVPVSAAMFGALHLFRGPAAFVGATVMGLVFGAAFVKSRSIVPLVMAHSIYNLWLSFSI